MGLIMRLKKFFIAVLFVLSAGQVCASIEAPFDLELRGLYLNAPFTGFNEYYNSLFSYTFTINAPGSNLKEFGAIEALAGYMPVTDTVVYLRLGYNMTQNTDTLFDTYHKTDVVTSLAAFNIFYAGGGIKQRFPVFLPELALYLAADAGACINIKSYWNVTADTAVYFVNPDFGIQEADFSGDAFFGGNLEAGIEWKILDFAGISALAGYRLAKFNLNFGKSGLFADPHYDQAVEVDISGLYFGGGLNFYFSDNKNLQAAKPSVDLTVEPEVITDEKAGDDLYVKKDYSAAILSYAAALKAGGPFSIYKKLAYSYFRLGDNKKAAYYGGVYLKYFPEDTAVKNWLEKLK
jgi:hypothetical protein